MRLSDVFGHLDLAVFPIVGLICFATVFAAAVWRIFRADKKSMQYAAHMALHDDYEDSEGEGE